MKLASQFLTFFFLLQKGYHELSGMVAAARQACAHPSLIDLGREHSRKVAELNRDRRKEENKQKKNKALSTKGAVIRESIRQLAAKSEIWNSSNVLFVLRRLGKSRSLCPLVHIQRARSALRRFSAPPATIRQMRRVIARRVGI